MAEGRREGHRAKGQGSAAALTARKPRRWAYDRVPLGRAVFNWAGIVAGTLAILPAGLVMFVSYGRYDGMFRDNVVFLNFIGGMVLGLVVGAFLRLTFLYAAPEIWFILVASLVPLVMTSFLNRRRWRGERHAIFNGGAMGIGGAAMTVFTLWRPEFETLAWTPSIRLVLGAVAATGVLGAVGLLLGRAVLQRRPIRQAGLGALAVAPLAFLLFEFLYGPEKAWLWGALAVSYGGALYAYAVSRVLPLGVSDDDRKRLRRFVLRKGRDG